METKTSNEPKTANNDKAGVCISFICEGCKHELPEDYQMRTKGWCYLCDPHITVAELLSDEPWVA